MSIYSECSICLNQDIIELNKCLTNCNHDYVKPCKSEYIFKHTIYECPYCLEHYPEKFKKIR